MPTTEELKPLERPVEDRPTVELKTTPHEHHIAPWKVFLAATVLAGLVAAVGVAG